MKTDQAQAIFTKRIGMFVELVYDKRNVEGLKEPERSYWPS
jgi:hypothetical protein